MKTIKRMIKKSIFLIAVTLFTFYCQAVQAQSFIDGPGNETDGDFPRKWDLVEGSARIGTLEGNKVILLSNKTTVTPFLDTKNYLSDTFTLEFEVYFDEVKGDITFQYYTIGFWDGTGHVSFPSNGARASYYPIQVFRHGAIIKGTDSDNKYVNHSVFLKNMESEPGLWRSVTIDYNKGALKVSIDGTQILNIPRYTYKPEMITIGVIAQEQSNNFVHALRNIRLDGINLDSSTDGSDGNSGSDTSGEDEGEETTTKYSGLEALQESTGFGWRLIGRDPTKYGDLGAGAVDFSFSTVTNDQTGATGLYSFATGESTTASAYHSTAMGFNTTASGKSSIVMGNNSTASGINAMAVGAGAKAEGDQSVAMGTNVAATGNSSMSFGKDAWAKGDFSVAMGQTTIASGKNSFAMGRKSQAGDYAVAFGFDTRATEYSAAMGEKSLATGKNSLAVGFKSEASGRSSVALGSESVASGNYSIAMGTQAEALKEASISIGRNTISSARWALATGLQTSATGEASTALGSQTVASGRYATALGFNSRSESYANTAIGTYNIGGGESSYGWVDTDPIFEIGNGNSIITRNALTVLKNGNVGIGTNKPRTKLHIQKGTDATLSGGGYLVLGDESKTSMALDFNEILVRDGGKTSTLYLQNDGGDVFVGGNLVHSSDGRFKQDIEDLTYGLNEILELRPVSYYWKSEPNGSQRSIGLIAQEVQPILNELISINENRDSTLGVNYTELIPVLIKAIQEQQQMIDGLKYKLESLESKL
jgi:Chaperone of endosialidase/YadA head domain repeat (2 copies)